MRESTWVQVSAEAAKQLRLLMGKTYNLEMLHDYPEVRRLEERITEQVLLEDDNEAMVNAARDLYAHGSNDDIEVDENAAFSRADGGTWVMGWLWVNHEELEGEGK